MYNPIVKHSFLHYHFLHVSYVLEAAIILEEHREQLPVLIPEWKLIHQVRTHDADKFSPELVAGQYAIQLELYNATRGIATAEDDLAQARQGRQLHYEMNRHHLEYHARHQSLPSNVDLCEMCCDMASIAKMKHESDYTQYFRDHLQLQHTFCQTHAQQFIQILRLLQIYMEPLAELRFD